MKKSKFGILLMTLLAAFVLSACNDAEDEATTEAPAAAVEEAPAETMHDSSAGESGESMHMESEGSSEGSED